MKLKSVIIRPISITLLLFVYLSLFSATARDAEALNEIMVNFPEGFLMAFGMNGIDISNVLGFYGLAFLFSQKCISKGMVISLWVKKV